MVLKFEDKGNHNFLKLQIYMEGVQDGEGMGGKRVTSIG